MPKSVKMPAWVAETTVANPMPAMPLLGHPPPWNAHFAGVIPLEIGKSWLGNAITLHHPHPSPLLVMGGVHGDEAEGIFLAHLLLASEITVPLIPCLNPDGALLHQRWNRHNIDLNRNLPAADWSPTPLNPRYPPGPKPASEPETQAFLKALELIKPSVVLSLHSYTETFVEAELPDEKIPTPLNQAVDRYVEQVGIRKKRSIGYPTPGALGAYGQENDLVVFTYELPRGASHADLLQLLPAFLELVTALQTASSAAFK